MNEKINQLTRSALLAIPYNKIKPPLPHTKNFTGEISVPPEFVEKFLELLFEDIFSEFERNNLSIIDNTTNSVLEVKATLESFYRQ
jgi:hypothetical protein